MDKEKYYDIEYGWNDGSKPTKLADVPLIITEALFRAIKGNPLISYYKEYEKGILVKKWEKWKEGNE